MIRIMDFKFESWTAFFGAIFGSLFSFIAPVGPFIAIAVALVLFDLFTGIKAARKKGQQITSKGLSRTVEKISLYAFCILVLEGIKVVFFNDFQDYTYVKWLSDVPITYAGTFTIVLTELKSAAENLKVITNVDLTGLISKYIKFNKDESK